MAKKTTMDVDIGKFLRSLMPYLKLYKWSSILSLLCIIVIVIVMAVVPITFRYIFDNIIKYKNEHLLTVIFVMVIAAFIIRTIADSIAVHLITRISSGIAEKLRLDVFDQLQTLSEDFYLKTSSSELVTCYSDDINSIDKAVANTALPVIRSLLLSLVSFILIVWLAWPAALMLAVLIAGSLAIPRLLTSRRNQAIHLQKTEEKKLYLVFQEYITAHVVIRLYNLFNYWSGIMRHRVTAVADTSKEASFYNALAPRSILTMAVFAQILVVFIGAYAVLRGSITVGTVITLMPLSSYILFSTDFLVTALPLVTQAASAMKHINQILNQKPSVTTHTNAEVLPPIHKSILFQNVSFSYDSQRKVLNNIYLNITYGESIALVGSSGCGKSTVLNLLMRLYDPTKGAIIFDDNYKADEVTEESIRHQLSLVLQEPLLFNISIKKNIIMGKSTASDEEIINAAKQAGLHNDILSLPAQYDTVIGIGGKKLSGGQRQRLALARGFVRQPRVLLLDEVTSAVDVITEAEINKSILDYRKNCSLIITTH